MARLWSNGNELGNITSLGFDGTVGSGGGAVAISSTTVRSGTYSLCSSNSGAAGPRAGHYNFASANGNGPYYIRAYVRVDDIPDGLVWILTVETLGTGSKRGGIRLATDGTLELWDNAAKIGSSSSPLSLSTWYRLELYIFNNTGTSKMELDARLEGSSFASTITSTNVGTFANLIVGTRTSSVGSYNIFYDDIAINDTSGSFQNSWPGDGAIVHLNPDADGDNVDWSSNVATDWEAVDEVTPDDATSMIQSNTNAQITDVNLAATPGAIGSSDTINCVQVGVRFRTNSTAGTNPQFAVRIKATSGGTVEESSNITATTTSWNTNAVAAPRNYPLTLYDLPGASTTAWTKADLDTAQIGVSQKNASTGLSQVSTLWLLVDYTAAVGGGGSPEAANALFFGASF